MVVIAAVRVAVAGAAGSAAAALQLHLAKLLFDNDDFEGCIATCDLVLAIDATSDEAQQLRSQAADAIAAIKPPPGRNAPVRLEVIQGEKSASPDKDALGVYPRRPGRRQQMVRN